VSLNRTRPCVLLPEAHLGSFDVCCGKRQHRENRKFPMNHSTPLEALTPSIPNPICRSTLRRGCFLVGLALAWLALSPTARALNPPPDGGYPNANTAEGDSALASLTSGINNTAIGFGALSANKTGSFNTASGSQALLNPSVAFASVRLVCRAIRNRQGFCDAYFVSPVIAR